jgi:hypothetical protein
MRGGDSGKAILAGSGAESDLLRRVSSRDPKRVMPPAGPRLTPGQVALLRSWIDQGARWTVSLGSGVPSPGPPGDATRDSGAGSRDPAPSHWAFRRPVRPSVPKVKRGGWVRNPVDAFVLAKLERRGLSPSPEADRATLARRLSLDLLGLLPTPQEVAEFGADHRPGAYERLVDRLLASPHFGERWGRHWLDLARYADSDGYENDRVRANAWRYRDWVIDAVNRDLPYDRFVVEQLAGDLLPDGTPEQRVATGFHRNALTNSAGGADPEEFRIKAVKDRVNATGTVLLGLTVGCAQCHTHKYDPITLREYYGLFAFFNNSEDQDVEVGGGKAPALVERAEPRETYVHLRGDFLSRGEAVTPHTPAFLPPLRPRGERPDRLDLARWITDPAAPLTARVAVNQAWQHLFGQGLIRTPENLGVNGERPSHPELLDYLAARFARVPSPGSRVSRLLDPGLGTRDPGLSTGLGWSRKALIRLIVTSAVYRQSSQYRPELAAADSANALLGRQNRFRVEAEIVRDVALDAAGILSRKMGGPGFQPPLPAALTALPELKNEQFLEPSGGESRYRRGVYVHVQRTFLNPAFATFDVADASAPCTRRERSNTPLQALTLLNDPVFFECAQALGRRIIRTGEGDPARIRQAFELCLSRQPAAEEAAALSDLLREHRSVFGRDEKAAREMAGPAPVPANVTVPELAAWIGLARTLINLDEFTTRE